ncbi:MAG: hypothetical protein P8Q14_11825 [Vicingaceae bacterium]|nr:hypothetical protein [Vicingaceae bacterium]
MEEVTEQEKKTIAQKFKDFQLQGLISYGKYLTDQLEYASKSDIRKAYKKYIEDQIVMNNEKIEKLK